MVFRLQPILQQFVEVAFSCQGTDLLVHYCCLSMTRRTAPHQQRPRKMLSPQLVLSVYLPRFWRGSAPWFPVLIWKENQRVYWLGLKCVIVRIWIAAHNQMHSTDKSELSFVRKKPVTALLSIRTIVGFFASHQMSKLKNCHVQCPNLPWVLWQFELGGEQTLIRLPRFSVLVAFFVLVILKKEGYIVTSETCMRHKGKLCSWKRLFSQG